MSTISKFFTLPSISPSPYIKEHANLLSKIVAGFIFAIAIVYYTITVVNSNNMDKQMLTVKEHPYIVSVTIGDIKSHLTLLRALPERLVHLNSPQIISGIKKYYIDINNSMLEKIDILRQRYLGDKTNVPLFQDTYLKMIQAQNELLAFAAIPGNSAADISALYQSNVLPKLDKLDSIAAAINIRAGEKLNEYANLVAKSRANIFTMATALTITLLLTITFYLYLLNLKFKAEEEMFTIRSKLELEQRANSAKTKFLFNMSHDIRTPMNAIIGLTAIAAMHLDKREKIQECLTKISLSSKHLLGLINDVLDMSRIESGKVLLNEENFLISELINDLRGIVQTQAAAKAIKIEVNIHNLVHEKIIGDAIRIRQILVNIVGNALKFTPEGGQVWLTIEELPSTIKGHGNYRFIARDTGIGMSEQFLEKLFLPFERAENSTKSGIEGTGLGMAITKNIVDMMGGRIKVSSELGKGSTFTVSLPLKLQGGEDASLDFTALRDLRSLVVDDDIIACENTARMIHEIGMRCDWVLTGTEAVEKVRLSQEGGQDYHVIIIDWAMPEMDGVETARRIRAQVGEVLPIIFLTAYDWTDMEEEARAAGVNAFLSKPVFMSTLHRVMHELAGGNDAGFTTPPAEAAKQYKGNILLVEDNTINMEIAKEFLEFSGLTVDQAWDGQHALDAVKAAPAGCYDIIFMDVQMPNMDGYEATRQIRRFEASSGIPHTPVVGMSANAFAEEIDEGYAAGMDDYVTKPVDFNKLRDVLERYSKSV